MDDANEDDLDEHDAKAADWKETLALVPTAAAAVDASEGLRAAMVVVSVKVAPALRTVGLAVRRREENQSIQPTPPYLLPTTISTYSSPGMASSNLLLDSHLIDHSPSDVPTPPPPADDKGLLTKIGAKGVGAMTGAVATSLLS